MIAQLYKARFPIFIRVAAVPRLKNDQQHTIAEVFRSTQPCCNQQFKDVVLTLLHLTPSLRPMSVVPILHMAHIFCCGISEDALSIRCKINILPLFNADFELREANISCSSG